MSSGKINLLGLPREQMEELFAEFHQRFSILEIVDQKRAQDRVSQLGFDDGADFGVHPRLKFLNDPIGPSGGLQNLLEFFRMSSTNCDVSSPRLFSSINLLLR